MAKNLCGTNIKKLRMEANMSIEDLSRKIAMHDLAVDEAEIERIEAGESSVTDLELIAFSQIFTISPDILLCTAG